MLAFPDPNSLLRRALHRLGDKWTPDLIRLLALGPRRFSHLSLELAVAPKVLASTLRGLQQDGFVTRLESPAMQRQVAYGLTPLGHGLDRLLDDMEGWAERHRHLPASTGTTRVSARDAQERPGRAMAPHAPLEAEPTHLCLTVRDITSAGRAFARVFGLAPQTAEHGAVTGPQGLSGGISHCSFRLANFAVELIQPDSGRSPFRDFLDTFGDGVHHIGLRVLRGFDSKIRHIEDRGGRWTLGSVADGYIFFDLTEQLGSTIELVVPDKDRFSSRPCSVRRPAGLGTHALGHIGVIVRDVEEAARQYAAVLGIHTSPVRTIEPGFLGRRGGNGQARTVSMRQKGVPLVLIEPVGPGPWRDFLDARGNAVHHIQFNVGDQFEALVKSLRRLGGRQVLGRAGLDYAHFDFTQDFGLIVGLTGTGGTGRRRPITSQTSA